MFKYALAGAAITLLAVMAMTLAYAADGTKGTCSARCAEAAAAQLANPLPPPIPGVTVGQAPYGWHDPYSGANAATNSTSSDSGRGRGGKGH